MGVQSTQFVEDGLVPGYLIRHHVGHQNERSKAKEFPVFCPGVDVLLRQVPVHVSQVHLAAEFAFRGVLKSIN